MRGFINKTPVWATVAVVSMTLAGCSSDDGAAQGGSPSQSEAAPPASSAPAEPVEVEPSVCGLEAGDAELPADRPADLEVSTWRDVSLPTSKTHGPGEETARQRSCFAHDPEGAALAAINLQAQMATVEDINRIMSEGSVKDQIMGQWGTPMTGASVEGTPVAYRVDDFAGDRAQVTWAMRIGSEFRLAPYLMVWQGGDWLIDGETPASDRPKVESVSELDGQGLVMLDD